MKIGTIGTGFIVKAFIDAAIKNNITIEAVYSRKQETAKEFADEFGIEKTYTSLDEMFNDEEIDFIYVASPNSLHYSQSLKALLAGKNVICEKPFTTTAEQLQHLIDVANENNLFLFEAITNIHLPNFDVVKTHLNNLGNIKIVQCNYSQYSSRYDALRAGQTPNVFNPEFSGGAIMDINIYNIHFVMRLFGEPNAAKYYCNKHQNGIDTSGILMMQYDNFVVECVGAKDTKSTNMAQIQGEEGYIYIPQGANGISEVQVYLNDENKVINHQEQDNRMYYELNDFKEIYETKDYAKCNELLQHSLKVIKLVENVRLDANILFKDDNKS